MKPFALLFLACCLIVGGMPLSAHGEETVSKTDTAIQSVGDKALVTLRVGTCVYDKIEVALRPETQRRGLMERTSLPAGGGMLFVFPTEQMRSFWMKNTRIPLDILFLDAQWRVVSMHRMVTELPRRSGESEQWYEMRLPGYSSQKPAQYALELAAGQIEKTGVRIGDVVEWSVDR